jgi:hypothetical protein
MLLHLGSGWSLLNRAIDVPACRGELAWGKLDRAVKYFNVRRPKLNSQSPCVTTGSDADRCGFIADGQTI